MKVNNYIILLSILAICCTSIASGQKIFISNYLQDDYRSEEYTSSPQNWDISQDRSGRILVANTSGVLLFDGSDWSMIGGTENLEIRNGGSNQIPCMFTPPNENVLIATAYKIKAVAEYTYTVTDNIQVTVKP